ncbi:MAG: DUF5320 domain-containing protein [Anaerolineae bacterium]|nr:DUF5320 domain-containing protein [Anaerolineae bacterium]
MTGRGVGYCSGSNAPGCDVPGPRMGRGAWRAWGGGRRGYRNWFHATGLPLWARWGPFDGTPVRPPYDEVQEVADLKAHASRLGVQLSAIQARLDALLGKGKDEGGE